MSIKQYKVGKQFEEEILEYYDKKGYFAYKFPTEYHGTICDIMVAKRGACLFIECKHITGNKLYYKGCGLYKKRDEINRFVEKTKNNVYIYIKSDKYGYFWTTWAKSKGVLEATGYLDVLEDCYSADLSTVIFTKDPVTVYNV